MGDIRRKKKLLRKPKKLYEKSRIEEENQLLKKYGLKNKREIWKAESNVSKLRKRAKELIRSSDEHKQEFFKRLGHMGLKVKDIADALALTKEDWLDRRLQTIVFQKNISGTLKQARQLISHKHILVDGKAVNSPSFIVTTNLENKIEIDRKTRPESGK